MFDLSGKVAVVTGGGSGIGEAIARCFASAGGKVYIAERDAVSGARVAEEIRREGKQAQFIALDIADENAVQQCARVVLNDNGGLCDVLVNNAGIGGVGTVLTTNAEELDRLYAVNVKGTMFMCKAFLPA